MIYVGAFLILNKIIMVVISGKLRRFSLFDISGKLNLLSLFVVNGKLRWSLLVFHIL